MRTGAPPRAFVELKAPAKRANPTAWRGQDQKQFERFKELNCWSTCNFFDFRLLARGEETGQALVVPERTLRPDQDDARADRAIADHDPSEFLGLLERLTAGAGEAPSPS